MNVKFHTRFDSLKEKSMTIPDLYKPAIFGKKLNQLNVRKFNNKNKVKNINKNNLFIKKGRIAKVYGVSKLFLQTLYSLNALEVISDMKKIY